MAIEQQWLPTSYVFALAAAACGRGIADVGTRVT